MRGAGALTRLPRLWSLVSGVTFLVVLAAAGIGVGVSLRSDEQRDATPASILPDHDCVALLGPEPWIMLHANSEPQYCVAVAEFQNIQVWNKGMEPMTVDWPDGERQVAVDDHFDTGPIGEVLQVGPNEIVAAPFVMPTIWLLAESLSPTSGIEATDDGFGPVRVGMTLDEASAELGLRLETVEPVPGPNRWIAAVHGDPYSPTFLSEGSGDGTSVIVEILLHGPRR